VAADDAGNVAASARIWFEQDAGADFDPVTGTPASSGYPVTGGVTSTKLFNYGFTDLSTIPETHDAGLIVPEPGAVEAVYPEIDTFASLAPVGATDSSAPASTRSSRSPASASRAPTARTAATPFRSGNA
jgi:hypothetical protein